MLKKTMTYTDFDGIERTEDFYFNFTKAELLEMESGVDGGMRQLLEKIVNAKNQKQIAAMFKEILLKAYGEKTPDGRRFIKSKEISEAFMQTEAYSDLYLELLSNTEAAIAFITAVIPPKQTPPGTTPFPG